MNATNYSGLATQYSSTQKQFGASWAPSTSGLSVTVAFIEDSTGTTKHTGTVDASVGTYKATYTLAGSSDANDAANWPDGKYRIVVTPAGGSATTLYFWKDTVAPTNHVTSVEGYASTAGQIFYFGHSNVALVGQCGTDTVTMSGLGTAVIASYDSTTFSYSATYGIPDINAVYTPQVIGWYCIDDAGNEGPLDFGGVVDATPSGPYWSLLTAL